MNLSNRTIELGGGHTSHTRVSNALVLCFLLTCLLPFAIAWGPMGLLFKLVATNDTFSQIPLIPLISLFLIYDQRTVIFAEVSFGWILGASLMVSGMLLLGVARLNLWQLGFG